MEIRGIMTIREPSWMVFDHLNLIKMASAATEISALVNWWRGLKAAAYLGTRLDSLANVKKLMTNTDQTADWKEDERSN
jgi:hypothetical protein